MMISEAIATIDAGIGPFDITFFKKDGQVRAMRATKREKEKSVHYGKQEKKSFHSNQERHTLLLNEQPGNRPHSIKIFSILTFNGEKVYN
jgi:hypothetical protein